MNATNGKVVSATVKTYDRLCQMIAGVLGVTASELSDTSSPDTIAAWDSLNHLNLVMALESEFGVSLSPEDALEMRTVGLMREILRRNGVEI
jgi:acyl carrier protein